MIIYEICELIRNAIEADPRFEEQTGVGCYREAMSLFIQARGGEMDGQEVQIYVAIPKEEDDAVL